MVVLLEELRGFIVEYSEEQHTLRDSKADRNSEQYSPILITEESASLVWMIFSVRKGQS